MKPSYEELEAKCAALAAENAGLKDAAEFATASDMWEELGGNVMRYQYQEWYADRLKSAMETPDTDAFLAEVRAQGVESAGEYLKQYAQGLHEEARLVLQDAGELCNGFAAQLRKGVQS
ncbi:TPA: hypothetical protein O8T86_002062 [Enterobacter asburiae]|nr:hypothetical protein [Enterobacter asburiae]